MKWKDWGKKTRKGMEREGGRKEGRKRKNKVLRTGRSEVVEFILIFPLVSELFTG